MGTVALESLGQQHTATGRWWFSGNHWTTTNAGGWINERLGRDETLVGMWPLLTISSLPVPTTAGRTRQRACCDPSWSKSLRFLVVPLSMFLPWCMNLILPDRKRWTIEKTCTPESPTCRHWSTWAISCCKWQLCFQGNLLTQWRVLDSRWKYKTARGRVRFV